MAQAPKEVKAIFAEAIQKATSEELNLYLDAVCSSNAQLRAEVESLLASHRDAGEFLAGLLEEKDTELKSSLTEQPGKIIGRYKLLEKIGEGGMAVVYMAEQQKPIRRRVALKIIKLGMDTKSVIARFEAERQALAMMDHPNIAKVLDAGATETGRPYFVMELVTGVSITEYCDKNRLNTGRRLELFIQVCSAVHHAHQKGIIHRDIKPTNVMVTLHDGKPVPKIIDFGIAKAINQRLTEKTLFTRYGHMVGTPVYMSPEQAEMSGLDIDTRTDVYSLGVLLYELLTGTTPFDADELREVGYIEMQRIIHEEEPIKPSTKLSTLGEILAKIAESRQTNPDLLSRLIRGDLDWIVMKSLEKDRTHRYDTASALAMDVKRHLDHKPILARAPSAIYRLKKLLHRHRSQVIATLAMAILIAAVITISSMWNQNRLKLAEAESLVHGSILFQARESFAKADYAEALERAKSILNSKYFGSEARLLYAGILVEGQQTEEAVTNLEDLLDDRPEIAGAAYSLLVRILWKGESSDDEKLKKIDEYRQKAEELLPETAEAYFLRAMMAITIKEKLELLDKALHIDPRHFESCRLRAFTFYASRKYEMMENDARVMVVLRPQDPLGYSLWAIALRELGHYEDAIQYYDAAIERTPKEDQKYTQLYDQRCEIYLRIGEYKRAIADAQDCLRLSPDSTTLKFRIFCALIALGNYEEASALFSEIADVDPDSKRRFKAWSMKYVFDTLEASRLWHQPDSKPEGIAFLAMLEAEETYNQLRAKGKRLVTDGFTADWSPDGTKLAFSMGVYGRNGLATFDMVSKETELLIVPGKNPKWSPDGRYIAFVRDYQTLPLSELVAAERSTQTGSFAENEEVWIVKADGTEPKYLVHGRWPSWSKDSKHVYSRDRNARDPLRSISIEDREAQPKAVMACNGFYPSVSPDNKYMAYVELGSQSLKILDLASQSLVAEWVGPPRMWWGGNWSPTSERFSIGGVHGLDNRTGLWIYDLDERQAAKILSGQITAASWAPDETELAFCVGLPFNEIWVASLDPAISTIDALGPGRTLDEHYQEMINHYTRTIETDPEDTESYLRRAQYSHYLHDKQQVHADMDKYRAILNPKEAADSTDRWMIAFGDQKEYSGFRFGTPSNLGPPINSSADDGGMSFSADGLMLVFSSNRSGGSGQRDLWMSTRSTASDPWAEPINLGPTINTSSNEANAALSIDGLTLYFHSNRPGGSGGIDLWTTTRSTASDPWAEPVNLGSTVNSAYHDHVPFISADGLELYFTSIRPGGYGCIDIWVSIRETKDDPWREPVNLGPPVNSKYEENCPWLSADGLTLFFSSGLIGGADEVRPGFGDSDIWVTRRKTKYDNWAEPVNLGPSVNSAGIEWSPTVSADGSTLYFLFDPLDMVPDRGNLGWVDIWQVPITPMPESPQKYGEVDSVKDLPESNDGKEVMPQKNR